MVEPTYSKAPEFGDVMIGSKTVGGTRYALYRARDGSIFLGERMEASPTSQPMSVAEPTSQPMSVAEPPREEETVVEKVKSGLGTAYKATAGAVVSGFEKAREGLSPIREVTQTRPISPFRYRYVSETPEEVVYEDIPPTLKEKEKDKFPIVQPLIRGGVAGAQWVAIDIPMTALQIAKKEKTIGGVAEESIIGLGAMAKRVAEKPVVGGAELVGGLIVGGKALGTVGKAIKPSKQFKKVKVSEYERATVGGDIIKVPSYTKIVRKVPAREEILVGAYGQVGKATVIKQVGFEKPLITKIPETATSTYQGITTVGALKAIKEVSDPITKSIRRANIEALDLTYKHIVPLKTIRKTWKVRPEKVSLNEQIGVVAVRKTQLGAVYREKFFLYPTRLPKPMKQMPIKVVKPMAKYKRTPLVFEKKIIGIPEWITKEPKTGVITRRVKPMAELKPIQTKFIQPKIVERQPKATFFKPNELVSGYDRLYTRFRTPRNIPRELMLYSERVISKPKKKVSGLSSIIGRTTGKVRERLFPSTKVTPRVSIKPRVAQKVMQRQRVRTTQKLKMGVYPRQLTSLRIGKPITFMPRISFNKKASPIISKIKIRPKKKYKSKYSPSLIATEFKIYGKIPKTLIGTEIRPLIRRRKR